MSHANHVPLSRRHSHGVPPVRHSAYETPTRQHHHHSTNYDLRIILVRHGERMDKKYGDDWYAKIFGEEANASTKAYADKRLPRHLPQRSPTFHYILDPPLTIEGQQKSFQLGHKLASKIDRIDYCFASPASRCVLTADAILSGMNRKHMVPIRIEPYIFEPLDWNTALQGFPEVQSCISVGDWMKAGLNIDARYHPVNSLIPAQDNELEYYKRSRLVFQSLEDKFNQARHQQPIQHRTVLIVGHSATPWVYPMIANGEPFDPVTFKRKCDTSRYLETAILDRDPVTRQWRQPVVL